MNHFPIAVAYWEGGEWFGTHPPGHNLPYVAVRFDSGWIFDFRLQELGYAPWRHPLLSGSHTNPEEVSCWYDLEVLSPASIS